MPEDKLHKLAGQLESILEYVDKIGQADIAGVEPMMATQTLVRRERSNWGARRGALVFMYAARILQTTG